MTAEQGGYAATAGTYCKAYEAARLHAFPEWEADGDHAVLYVWQDLLVTSDSSRDSVVFDSRTQSWARFCQDELGFRVPEEIEAALAQAAEPAQGGSQPSTGSA